jgi:hypothetical protein
MSDWRLLKNIVIQIIYCTSYMVEWGLLPVPGLLEAGVN